MDHPVEDVPDFALPVDAGGDGGDAPEGRNGHAPPLPVDPPSMEPVSVNLASTNATSEDDLTPNDASDAPPPSTDHDIQDLLGFGSSGAGDNWAPAAVVVSSAAAVGDPFDLFAAPLPTVPAPSGLDWEVTRPDWMAAPPAPSAPIDASPEAEPEAAGPLHDAEPIADAVADVAPSDAPGPPAAAPKPPLPLSSSSVALEAADAELVQQLRDELAAVQVALNRRIEETAQARAAADAEAADLRRQLEEARRHAEGLRTDQARYRELQSLWSSEQTKRLEAEKRAEAAEGTVEAQQQRLDQKDKELKQVTDKMVTLKMESDEKVRVAMEQAENLEELTKQQNAALSKLEEAADTAASDDGADAQDELRQLKLELETRSVELERAQAELGSLHEQAAASDKQLAQLKADHEEQHRKEIALTNRLNAAKKNEAEKVNHAEQLEDELRAVKEELDSVKLELKNLQTDKGVLESTLEKLKKTSQSKIDTLEAALKDERALNEERKKKMKAFVETKADEVRQLQADNDALQSEVATTSKSLMDLNGRWKQLHAQWVQSQTRNRELQRDLNRMQKDSENLHKVGDSIQMKLSLSSSEKEEHKSKRLAAKQELMNVLRKLESECELTTRLRDSIKFTFTPKALSQQQLIQEALDEFEALLLKLSQRLSVPLPPTTSSAPSLDSQTKLSNGGPGTLDDDVAKLDHETQRVSHCIMSLSDNVERLRVILEMGVSRSCATVLAELLSTGGLQSSPAIAEDRAPITGARMNAVRSHRYGQVRGGPP